LQPLSINDLSINIYSVMQKTGIQDDEELTIP